MIANMFTRFSYVIKVNAACFAVRAMSGFFMCLLSGSAGCCQASSLTCCSQVLACDVDAT